MMADPTPPAPDDTLVLDDDCRRCLTPVDARERIAGGTVRWTPTCWSSGRRPPRVTRTR